MSKYIVIPISISLKNKKFADSGDVIDESQLNSPTHELVKDGFIRLATEEEIEAAGQIVPEEEAEATETKEAPAQEISKKDQVKNAFKK